MQIPSHLSQARNIYSANTLRPFSTPVQNTELKVVQSSQKIQNHIDTLTPQSYHYGNVAQLVSSRYLYELRKDIRRILRGKKLKALLDHNYTLEEFESLPTSLKTLITFDKTINSAEILQFMEAFDKSHEITFRDYAFDRIKFRAIFEALGGLIDVEMQAGSNTYIALSDSFEIKKKIREVFVDLKDKIKESLVFKTNNKSKKLKAPKPLAS